MRKSLALVLLFLVLAGCIGQPKLGTNQIPVKLIINYSDHVQTFDVAVPENTSAFDLLKQYALLDYTTSAFGAFINSINNVSNAGDKYWMFYINGKQAEVGVSSYFINDSVIIEMRYERPAW